ncbi:MAG: hypothetical protein JWR69_1099 [Pedosphaera sp.]|nr:hypothetical protein [Pedosphaera sp.]
MTTMTVFFTGILAKLQDVIEMYMPLGYEDETGFHFGVKST